MRTHDYLRETSHDYREAIASKDRAHRALNKTHSDWLLLRRKMRTYFKEHPDYDLPDEIKRLIGWKS